MNLILSRRFIRITLLTLAIGAIAPRGFAAELRAIGNEPYTGRDTLAPIDEASEDARRCLQGLVWQPADFEVRCEAAEENRGDWLVRFPSPIDSGDATNDRVAMEWYQAKDEASEPIAAPAVVVVHESGRGMTVGRLIARGLRQSGLHTFLVHLPHYGQRGVGAKPADAGEFILRMRQAIADVRRARDAVAALPLVQTDCIAVQGTSLGGFVAATTAGLDRGYDRVFLMLAGGDLHDLIQNGAQDAAKLRKELAAAGLSGEKLQELLHTVEPLRLAHRIDPSRTWLYSGSFDPVVPAKNSQLLADAAKLDDRHHVSMAADHYSGILFLPFILGHMKQQVLAEPPALPEYEWQQVTLTAPFAPRDGAGALSFAGKMWLLGGWNPAAAQREFFPRICNNEVWSSADGRDWTLVKPNTFKDRSFNATADWEGRHTAGYAVFRDRMWIIGGDCNQGHYQNDVWTSTDGKTWTYVNKGRDVPWGPRALHYTVVHDDKLWVIGGQTMPAFGKADEVFYRDAWTTTDGVNWTKVEPQEPCWSARGMIGGSAVMNGRIWILGGGTYDTPQMPSRKFHNDVWSSADGVQWKQHTAAAPWHPRQYHDVAVWDGRLWVMEGYHQAGGNRKDVWHSADGEHWHEVPNTPWAPRHAASLFVHDGSLWMVAGNNMQPDVWRLRRKQK